MTPKQTTFVAEYLVDLNASAAARRAGYSAHRADAMGHENLRKPEIAEAIRAAQSQRAARVEITQDIVMRDIEAIKRDAMQVSDGAMVNHAAALKAAELQGRHVGMWPAKLAVTGADGGAILIDESARIARVAQLLALAKAREDDVPPADQ